MTENDIEQFTGINTKGKITGNKWVGLRDETEGHIAQSQQRT